MRAGRKEQRERARGRVDAGPGTVAAPAAGRVTFMDSSMGMGSSMQPGFLTVALGSCRTRIAGTNRGDKSTQEAGGTTPANPNLESQSTGGTKHDKV